ncbi:MAG: OmpH family outer membrane protein [Deltaproteobacteria bacterium]|nr:OmpH family outer membrane protein [Deltaproteobacteria bacterium]
MKKTLFMVLGVLFLLGIQGQGVLAADVKIGVLNMKKLQRNSTKFQEIRQELKQKFDALQKKLDAERAQIEKLEQELQKQSMMLSLDAKEGKQKDLEKRTRHYKYMYGEVSQEMKDAEMEATRKVGKVIEGVVEKIAEKGNYTVILEQGTMGLVYYNDAIDLTDQVTKAYDQLSE